MIQSFSVCVSRFLFLPICGLAFLIATQSAAQISPEKALPAKAAERVLRELEKCVDERAFALGVDFSDLDSRLGAARDEIDRARTQGEFARQVNRVLDSYGISHLMLFDPDLARLGSRGDELGAGLKAARLESGQRLVTSVLPNSPAQTAGIQPGDVITEIDGQPLEGTVDDSHLFSLGGRLLPGQSDLRTVQLLHKGADRTASLRFAKHASSLPLELEWKQGSGGTAVAWLTVNSFRDYEPGKVEAAFREIRDRNAKALVLDLRSNGGGFSMFHQHLASLLVPRGTPLYRSISADNVGDRQLALSDMASAGDVEIADDAELDFVFTGKLVIIVDGTNGSAGELFPAYMRQTRDATLVGSRTNGAVLGAVFCDLKKGFRMLVPILEVVPLDGERIEGRGVEPDVVLSPPETANDTRVSEVVMSLLAE